MPKETGETLCETWGNVRENGGETCEELPPMEISQRLSH